MDLESPGGPLQALDTVEGRRQPMAKRAEADSRRW